ncbi:hypothetical protein BC940DRAFT_41516 [Gongronella butleri]|nr:hypothetical protein BC940DRAFT_41516 [Gongronella butleri]
MSDYQQELEEAVAVKREATPENNTLRLVLIQLMQKALHGERPIDMFVQFARQVTETAENVEDPLNTKGMLLSAIKRFECQLDCLEEAKIDDKVGTYKENLAKITTALYNDKVLTKQDCIDHLSSSLMEKAGVIKSKMVFDRQYVRFMTNLKYKQKKYNLLREDMVGYSALMNQVARGTMDVDENNKNKMPPTPLDRIPSLMHIMTSLTGKALFRGVALPIKTIKRVDSISWSRPNGSPWLILPVNRFAFFLFFFLFFSP